MSQEINYQSLGKRRILVAEDVELNQYLARHIMESWGFEVEIAVNGREALRKVQESDYDLILMDIQMPEMDGMEATLKIRALENNKKSQVPIVALTANALRGDSEKYMAVGMNDYLSKPFDEPRLFQVISKNLDMAGKQNIQPEIFVRSGVVEPAESAVSAELVESAETAEFAKLAESAELAASAKSAESAEFAECAEFDECGEFAECAEFEETSSAVNAADEIKQSAGEQLYSLAMVEAISGGDQDFVKRMLQLFLDTMPGALKDLEAATGAGHWEALSKQAHKLKSTIDSMGIARLKQLVRTIESNSKTGTDTEQIPALVNTLVATLKRCMDQIKKDYSL